MVINLIISTSHTPNNHRVAFQKLTSPEKALGASEKAFWMNAWQMIIIDTEFHTSGWKIQNNQHLILPFFVDRQKLYRERWSKQIVYTEGSPPLSAALFVWKDSIKFCRNHAVHIFLSREFRPYESRILTFCLLLAIPVRCTPVAHHSRYS